MESGAFSLRTNPPRMMMRSTLCRRPWLISDFSSAELGDGTPDQAGKEQGFDRELFPEGGMGLGHFRDSYFLVTGPGPVSPIVSSFSLGEAIALAGDGEKFDKMVVRDEGFN